MTFSRLAFLGLLALRGRLFFPGGTGTHLSALRHSQVPRPPLLNPPTAKYLLDRVDDAAVVQLYADGFEALPLKQKTLIWHLYQAAIAGRDMFIDQKHRDAIAMREIIEPIVAFPKNVDAATLAEIERYTKLFWLNNGPYNNLTARKFVLKTTPEALKAAVMAAAKGGARFMTREETIDGKLARLEPMFFDPNVDPIVTSKTPGAGKDILQASANNLYSNVSVADLKGFTEKYGLNSRLVKQDGKLKEEVYRINERYGRYITEVVKHLEAAKPFAEPPMAKALDALIKFYRTGEEADRKAYDIAWVQDKDSPVDTINGFIEVYLDPRGVKGAWEGLVFYVNQEKTQRIKTIATNAQWFEDHMPWDQKYRKPSVQGIVANAIDVVIETGDSGPVTPIGINLPNDQEIREKYGSKSVALSNVNEAYDRSAPPSMRGEFTWSPEEAQRAEKFATFAGELTTDMHEVIGHASGRQAEGKANPQALLKEDFSALEEGRADLVGLYFLADPKMVELGIIPAADHDNMVRAEYESYARNAIVQLRRIREGTQIEEDHMRNRQMIVRWLMANTKAIEERQRDGKTYLVMVDPKAFREGVGRLLAEVQRIKSEGDYAAGKKLFETYGVHFDAKLRDEVVARVDKLNLPSYSGFVMPKLTAVTGTDGAITDVKISYPLDLKTQMLEVLGADDASRSPMTEHRVSSTGRYAMTSRLIGFAVAVLASIGVAAQTPAPRTFTPERFYNTFSFAHPPAMRIKPGERIVTKTADASGMDWNGKQVAQGPNPQTGPFYVEGAEPGDMLVVSLEKLELNRATGYSSSLLAPYAVDPAALIARVDREPRRANWLLDKAKGTVRLDGADIAGVELRARPMLGCVGVAPARKEAIATSTPGPFGGNMDYAGMNAGVKVMLPVYEPGALLFIGDAHALQGEGEVVGTGVETSMDVEFSVQLIKKTPIQWPRLENDTHIMVLGSERPLLQALQHATSEMHRWLMTEYQLSERGASTLMGQTLEYEVGNVVDPHFTMVAKMRKSILAGVPRR